MKPTIKNMVRGILVTLLLVSLRVSAQPTATLTAPVNGGTYAPGSNITLSATASASSGYTVSKVEFFRDTTLIGTDMSAPYSINWNSVPQGNYAITAKVTTIKKNQPNQTATSSPRNIIVSAIPTVSLTAPANLAAFGAPANITLTASANDSDGTVARVEYYVADLNGVWPIGNSTQPPYTFIWTNVPPNYDPGAELYWSYGVQAIAVDNQGAKSAPSGIEVWVSPPPSVSLTSPANNAQFTAPANITLTAVASDNGSVTRVEFYHGATLITTRTASPFEFNWTGVAAGTYSLTARAIDDVGVVTTSAAVTITVVSAEAKLHFIHVDHLNTPRLVTNIAGTPVWRWDQQEPFGANVADENPSSLGMFEFPLRFPGQYADRETNLYYNYFRDYDPGIGRYAQSDPIGLDGDSVNTYAYVDSNPLVYTDQEGLRGGIQLTWPVPYTPPQSTSAPRYDPAADPIQYYKSQMKKRPSIFGGLRRVCAERSCQVPVTACTASNPSGQPQALGGPFIALPGSLEECPCRRYVWVIP